MLKSDFKIFTNSLELRCFTTNDLEDMMELRSNPINTPYAPNDIWKTPENGKGFLKYASLFYDDNPNQPSWFCYFFAIRERNNEKVIGYCAIGACDFDRSLTEIFYNIINYKWNNGYATEAVKAMLEFGFLKLGLKRIIGYVHPENVASRRVLEKSGFQQIGILDNIPNEHDYFGSVLYEIYRKDY